MKHAPLAIEEFLAARRIAVVGVARDGALPGNLILRRLRETGHQVVPVHPSAASLEGEPCFADVRDVPGVLDGVVFSAPPRVALDVVRACAARGVKQVWFHRSFGEGSVSRDAVDECRRLGIRAIVGGCPMMYCGSVDPAHRCFRWLLEHTGGVRA